MFEFPDFVSVGLNPSFSGCPALGRDGMKYHTIVGVLIPLLVDVPLWGLKLLKIGFL